MRIRQKSSSPFLKTKIGSGVVIHLLEREGMPSL